jgi:2-polyprenyl-3-methyl-5-hydroxy-6-metoxy-1,4-benzoquinol methylase
LIVKAGGIRDWLSSKSSSGREKILLAIIYHRYIRRNKRVSFILDPKLSKRLEPLAGERDWPGNPRLLADGWSNMMLLRYALAMHYSKGKTILDSCCGIGWGAYMLDAVTLRTIAVDKDAHSLSVAKKLWPGQNIEYINASVLNLPFASGTFDLVTAMESIEHFPVHQIDRYLSEIARVLKPGGILIGSSVFPETSTEAESICVQNPHHLHINTRSEMIRRLQDCDFKQIKIFANRLFFFARKEGGVH